MTIAAIWFEDGHQWCAADTRVVAGSNDITVSEIGSKIFSMPVSLAQILPNLSTRAPHHSHEYGFVFAGSTLPAVMTAATTSTLLSRLGSATQSNEHPSFEGIAELVRRISERFMRERRRHDGDGKFWASLFGFCPESRTYKVAAINARDDGGSFRVELYFPTKPEREGDPWHVLGSGTAAFWTALKKYNETEKHITKRVPRRVIDKMIADGTDRTVGGATSVGFAHEHGFELLYTVEPIVAGQPAARRTFNGSDLDTEIGDVFPYKIAMFGTA